MKNKTVAILLALFLGGFGAHRFYLNQPGLGILYLVFFWTFIPGFIAIVDIVRFLLMDNEKFNNNYGRKK